MAQPVARCARREAIGLGVKGAARDVEMAADVDGVMGAIGIVEAVRCYRRAARRVR